MILEIIPAGGIAGSRPIRIPAGQVVIRQDNGTPVCVAMEIGEHRSQTIAKVGDPDFPKALRDAGIFEDVVCDRLELPGPPPGAKLVAGPYPKGK